MGCRRFFKAASQYPAPEWADYYAIPRLEELPNLSEITISADHYRPKRWPAHLVREMELETDKRHGNFGKLGPWAEYIHISPETIVRVVESRILPLCPNLKTVKLAYTNRLGGFPHRSRRV